MNICTQSNLNKTRNQASTRMLRTISSQKNQFKSISSMKIDISLITKKRKENVKETIFKKKLHNLKKNKSLPKIKIFEQNQTEIPLTSRKIVDDYTINKNNEGYFEMMRKLLAYEKEIELLKKQNKDFQNKFEKQNIIIENSNNSINNQINEVNELNNQVAKEKDKIISEKDIIIQKNLLIILEKERIIEESQHLINEKQQTIDHIQQLINKMQESINEKDKTIKKHTIIIKEKERIIEKNNLTIKENIMKIDKLKKILKERKENAGKKMQNNIENFIKCFGVILQNIESLLTIDPNPSILQPLSNDVSISQTNSLSNSSLVTIIDYGENPSSSPSNGILQPSVLKNYQCGITDYQKCAKNIIEEKRVDSEQITKMAKQLDEKGKDVEKHKQFIKKLKNTIQILLQENNIAKSLACNFNVCN